MPSKSLKWKVNALVILIILGAWGLQGCRKRKVIKGIYVVTTTGMLADATRNIGKNLIKVKGLIGSGIDPHAYKASTSDTRDLARADLIIYNGLHLEGKMQDILKKMAKGKPVVAASERIKKDKLIKPEGVKDVYDPHIWFDVSLWQSAVERIRDALIKLDPKRKAAYQKNAKAYLDKLVKLHKWTKTELSKIKQDKRYLVTSHDAFGYFGKAYGLKVIGLQGISTVTKAGVKDKERVIGLITKNGINAIFTETSVATGPIKSVIEDCKAKKHTIFLGGHLFSDAMGEEGTKEGTYIGMIQHNVKTISHALIQGKPLKKSKAQ